MSADWPRVPLGSVMQLEKNAVPVDAATEYRIAGVYSFGRGLFAREPLLGNSTTYKVFHRLSRDQFVLSQLKGWEGALARVTPEFDGWYLSPQFPTFRADQTALDIAFFTWFSKQSQVWEQLRSSARGMGARRDSVSPDKFLSLQIPLPPLAEQRRIVSRVDAIAARIADARRLREELAQYDYPNTFGGLIRQAFQGLSTPRFEDGLSADQLLKHILTVSQNSELKAKRDRILPPVTVEVCRHTIPNSWVWARLGDLCHLITDGTHLTPTYVEKGRPFLSAQNVKPFRFMPENHRCVSEADYAGYTSRVKPELGDILMTRVGAMIGEAAIIDQDIEFAFYVSLCLLKPVKEHFHVPYLLHWLNSPYGVASAKENTLGQGHSQGNLNLNLIRRFPVPLPPLDEQRQIVAHLDALQAKADALRSLQAEASAELDALLPAVLAKAFAGEL